MLQLTFDENIEQSNMPQARKKPVGMLVKISNHLG